MSRKSATERELEELRSAGIDGEALIASVEAPTFVGGDVPVITVYDADGAPQPFELPMLTQVPHLRDPLASLLAQRATEISLASMVNERWRLSRFVDFTAGRDPQIGLAEIDDGLLDDFRDWLDDHVSRQSEHKRQNPAVFISAGGDKLKADTKILIMETLLALLRRLRVSNLYSRQIRRDLDLIRGGDWKAPARRKPTPVLTRPQLKLLVRICREEVQEITARLEAAWAIIDGGDAREGGNLVDPELLREVLRLAKHFSNQPPTRARFKNTDDFHRGSFPRLFACDSRAYNSALALLYPSGRLLMPFLLLFAVFYRYNPSVLTGLEDGHFTEQPSVRGTRLVGSPFKARSGRTQIASWPVTADDHNPKQMLKTLKRWTASIRDDAPLGHRNHVFLERYSGGKVRSLANRDGLPRALCSFLDDHEQALGRRFQLKSLRPTVINLAHHLFEGDLFATLEVGQQLKVRTVVDHYLSDGARQLNDELLVPVFHGRDAWLRSGGRNDPREGTGNRYDAAATPGWDCEDRYFSPITQKASDLLCTEYGLCATCPMGRLRSDSPQAYAFVVKLMDAIRRSRATMPEHAWLERWSPILDHIDRKTERQFDDAVKELADLDIPDLPTVE